MEENWYITVGFGLITVNRSIIMGLPTLAPDGVSGLVKKK